MASGDVVNTAARLQSAAPVNGILADETTYRATRQAIDYDDVAAGRGERQGRADRCLGGTPSARPPRCRRRPRSALGARGARAGGRRPARRVRAALAARGRRSSSHSSGSRDREEPPRLRVFAHRRGGPRAHHLAPGSLPRLRGRGHALGARRDRQGAGRDPRAGLRRRGRAPRSAALSRTSLADSADLRGSNRTSSRSWDSGRESELGGDRRNEAFAAWRRFFEAMAEQRPLVLVFEDLHWADEGLLDFVDELVEWVSDVPLLVVATARPELLERRPGWGGGKLNATTLALSPLSDEQTAQLIAQLLGTPASRRRVAAGAARAGRGQPALRRAVRRAVPRTRVCRRAAAARDAAGDHRGTPRRSPGEEKELLHDAAVVGKVFWVGALRRDEQAGRRHAAFARAQGIRAPPAALVGRGRGGAAPSPMLSSGTSPTARSPAPDRGREAPASRRRGSRGSAARKITPRCSPTTGAPHSSSPGPRDMTGTTSPTAPGSLCAQQATARLR